MNAGTVTGDHPYLQLRELVALEHMRFTTANRVDGRYNGRHRSRSMGGSGEFADYRAYTPGDDLRRLDWRVLGRTGRAYIKRFQEDTNLSCLSVIDCSGSMTFDGHEAPLPSARWFQRGVRAVQRQTGVRPRDADNRSDKLTYAKFFTTALTHLITRGGDQASLALVGEGLHAYHEPGSAESHARRLYEAIETIEPSNRSDLAAGLDEVITNVRHRGVLLLISDFLLPPGSDSQTSGPLADLAAVLRRFRHQGWEIVMLHLIHPAEESLPEGVSYRFEGMEGESSVDCHVAEIRDLYRVRWREHLDRTQDISRSVGADYRRVSTATPYLDTLSDFLVQRSG